MNENIINYLRENKEKFSKEILIEQLRKTDYVEADILEGEKIVYNENTTTIAPNSPLSQASFWNFKAKKVYLKPSEKWKDFLFGFFSAYFIGIFLSLLWVIIVINNGSSIFGSFIFDILLIKEVISFIFFIFFIFYFFNRRRFISYGIMANFIVRFLIMIIGILGYISLNG